MRIDPLHLGHSSGNRKRLVDVKLCLNGMVRGRESSQSHGQNQQCAANHSSAVFIMHQIDIHKTFTVSGTVAKVEWINPHSYLTINVKDADGKVQKWAFELGGPGAL